MRLHLVNLGKKLFFKKKIPRLLAKRQTSPLDDGSCLLLANPSSSSSKADQSASTWFDGTCCGFFYVHINPEQIECLGKDLLLPSPPFLFAITLRHPNEAVWGERHPLRLLLALTHGNPRALVSDRDRAAVLAVDNPTTVNSSVLSVCGACNDDVCFIRVPDLNILLTGLGGAGELKIQLMVCRFKMCT